MTVLETTTPTALEAPTTAAEPTPANDFETLPEWAKEQIKSLRKESADRRSKLSSYEKAEEDRKAATLSDIEKAQNAERTASERAAALEARLVQRDAYSALNSANLIDAELAYLAIKDKITVENGEATNLEDLVKELVKNKPHLVKTTASPAPETRVTNPAATTTPTVKPNQIGRLFSSRK